MYLDGKEHDIYSAKHNYFHVFHSDDMLYVNFILVKVENSLF